MNVLELNLWDPSQRCIKLQAQEPPDKKSTTVTLVKWLTSQCLCALLPYVFLLLAWTEKGGSSDDLLTLIRSRDIAGLEAFFNAYPHKLNEYIFAVCPIGRDWLTDLFRLYVNSVTVSAQLPQTPLHYATTMSRVEVVKFLVDRGADQSLKILDVCLFTCFFLIFSRAYVTKNSCLLLKLILLDRVSPFLILKC